MSTPAMHLRIRLPDGSERSAPLDTGKTLRVGSNPGVEVVVAAAGVQPLHCGIVPKGDRYQIVASKSAGKVQVNGAAVAAAVLNPGDVIALGAASITVVAGAPAADGEELEVVGGDELEVLDAGDLEVLETEGLEILDDGGPLGLEAGGLMGLDASAGLGQPGLGQPGLGGMSLGDPLAGGFGPASLAGQMPQASATASVPAAAATRPRRSRRWLKGVAATVAVLLVAAIGVAVVLALPTADERFARAEQEYQANSFAEADKRFDAFLSSHPGDPRAGEARVKRDLARLAPVVDRGGDWTAALVAVKTATEQWGPLVHLRVAQAGLSRHLPRIATGLVERAGTAADRAEGDRADKALADARAALALAARLLPPSTQRGAGIDDLEVRLAALERDRTRSADLAAAVERITAAAGAGELAEAFDARAALLDNYPVLADNALLRDAQRQVAAAAHGQVRYATESKPAEPGEPEGTNVSLALASRGTSAESGADSTAVSGTAVSGMVAVLAAEHGAVYGLEAGGGRVVWRRFVGFDSDHPPLPLGEPAAAFLLYDSLREELLRIDAATGDAVWRQAVGPCDAPPVLHADRAFLALPQGELVELNAETGEIIGRFTLPQPLTQPPAIDPETGLCYQLADQGCLYVLSPERRTCDAVAYAGHERGLVDLPPLLVAGRVLVIERDGIADTRLRFFKLEGGVRPTHALDLAGRVGRPAVASDNIVWLATDDGTLHALENDPVNPDRAPQFAGRVVVRSSESPAVVATHLALLEGNLWAAGDGLRRLDAPSQPADAEAPPLAAGIYLQPPRLAGGGLLTVRAADDSAGALVALLGQDGMPRWETRIAAPLAAAPVLDPAGEALWLCRSDGAVFRVAIGQLPPVGGGGIDALFTLDGDSPIMDRAAVVPLTDGRTLLTYVGARAAWLHDDSGIERIELPAPVDSPPAPTTNGVMFAVAGGPVFVLPLGESEPRPAPFLPRIDLGAPPRWQGPAVAEDGSTAVVADQRSIYRLLLEPQPAPRLVAAAQAPLSSPLASPPAVVGQTAWGATEAGELLAFQLSDLSVVATIPLEGEVTFGPRRLGGGVLVATSDRRLRFLGEAPTPQWEVELAGAVVGVTEIEGTLLVALRDGGIAAFDVGSGAIRGTMEPAGEPLAAGPLVVDDRVVTVALDGTLLVSRRPWRELIPPQQ